MRIGNGDRIGPVEAADQLMGQVRFGAAQRGGIELSVVEAKLGMPLIGFRKAGVALARHVLEQRGLEPARVEALLAAVRKLWHLGD
jgi:hypothetical protein